MNRIAVFIVIGITVAVVLFSRGQWWYVFGGTGERTARIEFWVAWISLYVSLVFSTIVGFAVHRVVKSRNWWRPLGILLYLGISVLAALIPAVAASLANSLGERHSMYIFYGDAGMIPGIFSLVILGYLVVAAIVLGIGLYWKPASR